MTAEPRKYRRRNFPADTLEKAVQLAQTIQDVNNGRPMNRVLLADAFGIKPMSSDYRDLLSSSFKYGLTDGTEKSDSISLTQLGITVTRPKSQGDRADALKKAALTPDTFKKVYEHYDNGKLPDGEFFLNVLEQDYGVIRERCQECSDMLVANGTFAGVVRELKGTSYVVLAADPTTLEAAEDAEIETPADPDSTDTGAGGEEPPAEPQPQRPHERFIFVGHGKNRKPLEQLEKVLRQFQIPCKVAIDEAQAARPISVKVAQTMRECHSAILIFTADEEFSTPSGDTVWRPSENVVYELGAASILYDNRIVIFKEDGIEFPTNFRDIGYITFEKDRLDAKGVELIKELIALGLVKVQAA